MLRKSTLDLFVSLKFLRVWQKNKQEGSNVGSPNQRSPQVSPQKSPRFVVNSDLGKAIAPTGGDAGTKSGPASFVAKAAANAAQQKQPPDQLPIYKPDSPADGKQQNPGIPANAVRQKQPPGQVPLHKADSQADGKPQKPAIPSAIAQKMNEIIMPDYFSASSTPAESLSHSPRESRDEQGSNQKLNRSRSRRASLGLGSADQQEKVCMVANTNYKAKREDELSFMKGQQLEFVQNALDYGWVWARKPGGQQRVGLVPMTHVSKGKPGEGTA